MRFIIGYKLFILLTFIDVDLNFLFNFKYKQLHKHHSPMIGIYLMYTLSNIRTYLDNIILLLFPEYVYK